MIGNGENLIIFFIALQPIFSEFEDSADLVIQNKVQSEALLAKLSDG